MTNHLTEASGFCSIPQGNRVVCDHDERPVCLDAVPRAHKHLFETEMLLHVLMEGFDPDAFEIELDHLRFRHVQVVRDKEPRSILLRFGDKEKHGSNLGQMDQTFRRPKRSFLGSSNGLERFRSLCQESKRHFPSVHFHDSVLLDGGKEGPSGRSNQIENGSAGVPAVHEDRRFDLELLDDFPKDVLSNLDLAFEGNGLGANAFGSVALNRPNPARRSCFQNRSDGAQTLDQPIRAVMNSNAFDLLAVSGRRRVVQNEERGFGIRLLGQLPLVFLFELLDLLGGGFDKLVKAVGIAVSELSGDFADRSEFDEVNKTGQINGEISSLRLRENSQEPRKIRRNFLGCFPAHGFHAVLLAFAGIGDFGWKPFVLKRLLSSVT